ncbi:hypothetical protein HK096_011255, partial [Nowakowskiella sp. JEL0078]
SSTKTTVTQETKVDVEIVKVPEVSYETTNETTVIESTPSLEYQTETVTTIDEVKIIPTEEKVYTSTEYTTQDYPEVNEAEGYDVIEVVEDGVKRFLKRFFTLTTTTTTKTTTESSSETPVTVEVIRTPEVITEISTSYETVVESKPIVSEYTTEEVEYVTEEVVPTEVKTYTTTEYTTQDYPEVNEAEGYDVIEVVEDGVKRFLKRFFTKTTTTKTTTESSSETPVTVEGVKTPELISEISTSYETVVESKPVITEFTTEEIKYVTEESRPVVSEYTTEIVPTEVKIYTSTEYTTQDYPEVNEAEGYDVIEVVEDGVKRFLKRFFTKTTTTTTKTATESSTEIPVTVEVVNTPKVITEISTSYETVVESKPVVSEYTTEEVEYVTEEVVPTEVKTYTTTEYTTQDYPEVNEAEGYDVIEVVEDGVKRFLKRFFTKTTKTTSKTTAESSSETPVTVEVVKTPELITEISTSYETVVESKPVVSEYTTEEIEYITEEVVPAEIKTYTSTEYTTQDYPEVNEAEGYDVIEVVEDGVKRFLKRFFTVTKKTTLISSETTDEIKVTKNHTEVISDVDSSLTSKAEDKTYVTEEYYYETIVEDEEKTIPTSSSSTTKITTTTTEYAPPVLLEEQRFTVSIIVERLLKKRSIGAAKAFLFEAFTVVDWHTKISAALREAASVSEIKSVDWSSFTTDWFTTYIEAAAHENSDVNSDILFAATLSAQMSSVGITAFSAEQIKNLVKVWHSIDLFKDSSSAIKRVKEEYITGTLSSGSLSSLVSLARHCKVCWNVQLSSEVLGFKIVDVRLYKRAAKLLGLEPSQVVFVSSDYGSVKTAYEAGFITVFVNRNASGRFLDEDLEAFDIVVDSLASLENVVAQYSEAVLEETSGKKSKRSWFQKITDVASDVGKAVTRVAQD